MKPILSACVAAVLTAGSVMAANADLYAVVRGWEVHQDDNGCFAQHPEMGDIQWSIKVAPAGGWEVMFDDLGGHPDGTEFPARVTIDDQVFEDTYVSYGGAYVGTLPLDQRLALAKGSQVVFNFDELQLVFALSGSTAAMLKAEECWHQLTGFDPNTSSRRGSYAFK